MQIAEKNKIFLHVADELSLLINTKANELFYAFKNFDATKFDTSNTYTDYFLHHHLGNRLFFSIQNSAHILYQGIKKCNQPIHTIIAIDYGAGLGTLFMLGGLLGFKQFDYNDHLPEWQPTAATICTAIGSTISNFITGDIDAVTEFASKQHFKYHLVVSRNVIEHIYDLSNFYRAIFLHNPTAVTYSTTTANYHNIAMRWYHIYIHKKVEKSYVQQRIIQIKKLHPTLNQQQLIQAAKFSKGKGQQDFITTLQHFVTNQPILIDATLRSNTCESIHGVWCEHLLTKKEYAAIIHKAGFAIEYTAGYWDTHYKWSIFNFVATIFNKLIHALGKKNGILLSPFVNVISHN